MLSQSGWYDPPLCPQKSQSIPSFSDTTAPGTLLPFFSRDWHVRYENEMESSPLYCSDTTSSDFDESQEEEEERMRKRGKMEHTYSEMKESLRGCDNFEKYEIFSEFVRNMRFEQDIILSDAVCEFKRDIEEIQSKSSYKILMGEMRARRELKKKPDFPSLLNYYSQSIFPPTS